MLAMPISKAMMPFSDALWVRTKFNISDRTFYIKITQCCFFLFFEQMDIYSIETNVTENQRQSPGRGLLSVVIVVSLCSNPTSSTKSWYNHDNPKKTSNLVQTNSRTFSVQTLRPSERKSSNWAAVSRNWSWPTTTGRHHCMGSSLFRILLFLIHQFSPTLNSKNSVLLPKFNNF
jgi:hypothetical protein